MNEMARPGDEARRSRRSLLRDAGLGLIGLGAGAILSYGDTDRRLRAPGRPGPLEEARPNTRIVYNGHGSPAVRTLLRRYLQDNPEERIDLVELTAADAASRIKEERRAPAADVWIHPHLSDVLRMVEDDAITGYLSPEMERIPSRYRDERGRWYTIGLRPVALAYSRRILQEAKVPPPASAMALTDRVWSSNYLGPWKGEAVLGVPDPGLPPTLTWLSWLATVLGTDLVRTYLQTLRNQGVAFSTGAGDIVKALESEQVAVSAVEATPVLRLIASGDTRLDLAYPEQERGGRLAGLWANPTVVSLVRDTPGGRRLVDFLLSADAARIMVMEGFEFPVRGGIAIPASHRAAADGLQFAPQTAVEIARNEAQVREMVAAVLER